LETTARARPGVVVDVRDDDVVDDDDASPPPSRDDLARENGQGGSEHDRACIAAVRRRLASVARA
jgi:hypothetical protein|tara:strand:- start:284 stop:478 length:195 start_codon:yes stop_codon:yes gene_type:complete